MWDTLSTLFNDYGPIPRLLFEEFLPPDEYRTGKVNDGTGEVDKPLQHRIAEYDRVLQGKIGEALKLDPHIAMCGEDYGVNCSHTIFTMRPYETAEYQYVSVRPVYGLAAPDIGRRIAVASFDISLKDARRMYEFLLRQAETKTSAGWIFEARMHLVFQRGGPFEATKLGGSTTITVDIGRKPYKDFSRVSGLGSLLRKESGSPSIDPDIIGVYFQPQHCNFGAVGSFVITTVATTNEPLLVLFQMKVSTSHPVKAHGLASIWAEIPAELKATPPILVFVVPVDAANTFSRQKIVPSDSDTPNFDEWEQYVLPVSAETLWENITPDCEVSAS
jgi:hypothetical protein